MIALCRQHHDFADAGGFSKDELRSLKTRDYSADSVRANFPWAKMGMLIRLGGCYSGGSSAVLRISGDPVVSLTSGPSGLVFLSFTLRLPDGAIVASMIENAFQSDALTLHDLSCTASATRIKVWFAPRDIGLDLSFQRLTLDDLSRILQTDKERAENSPAAKRAKAEVDEIKAALPESIRDCLSGDEIQIPSSWIDRLPEHLREAYLSGDPVGFSIKRWALQNCVDADGRLTLLDFTNCSVNNAGRSIRIRNGIEEGHGFWRYCAAIDSAGSFNL
ncbi:MAG TPA: hypothetical protein DD670_14145 [Planctomycetaceae bacterium]|nr:hypothetical protein [Planctomycetaceae bacterium]